MCSNHGLTVETVVLFFALYTEEHIVRLQNAIKATFARDSQRILTPFSPELLERIAAARRERAANKIREREREARGEELTSTIRRARKGPPAYMLHRMTVKQIRMDKVARSSVSESGYVGYVKQKLGWKLKNEDPWKAEDGDADDQERLEKMGKEVMDENQRRRSEQIRTSRGSSDITREH